MIHPRILLLLLLRHLWVLSQCSSLFGASRARTFWDKIPIWKKKCLLQTPWKWGGKRGCFWNNERQPRKKASEIIRGLEKKHTSSKRLWRGDFALSFVPVAWKKVRGTRSRSRFSPPRVARPLARAALHPHFFFFFFFVKQISDRTVVTSCILFIRVWRNLPSENAPLRPKKTKSSRGIECHRVSFVRKRQRWRRRRGRARVRVLDVLFLFFSFPRGFPNWLGEKASFLRSIESAFLEVQRPFWDLKP